MFALTVAILSLIALVLTVDAFIGWLLGKDQ